MRSNFIAIFYINDKITVLIDFFFLTNKPIHPNTVVVIKNNALVIWLIMPVLLQDMNTFFVLTEFK